MKRMAVRRKKVDENASAVPPPAQQAVSRPAAPGGGDSDPAPALGQAGDSTAPENEAGGNEDAASGDPQRRPPRSHESSQGTARSEPLPLAERCGLAAANLVRIGEALEAYRQEHGKYPPQAIYDRSGAPLLSWRVALLPYLGHADLYAEFETDKPHNSPRNESLNSRIPAVFQSPERFDTRTNFLMATGRGTMFPGPRTASVRRIEDGLEHTVMVVEVNDEQSVPWTQPSEYVFSAATPQAGLGGLRQGHVFVIWGGGRVAAVALRTPPESFRAMFTIDGGEPLSSYVVSRPLEKAVLAELSQTKKPAVSKVTSPPDPTASGDRMADGWSSPSASQDVGLARRYARAAERAFAAGRAGDALLWQYAANLLQSPDVRWDEEYGWVAALQRPCLTVHFCVGVRGGTRTPVAVRETRRQTSHARDAMVGAISPVGERLLHIVERHAETLIPRELAAAESTHVDRHSSRGRSSNLPQALRPVTYLGIGTRAELTARARAKAGDVLVLFETNPPSATSARWISCDLIDLARGRRIVSVPAIHWQAGNSAASSPPGAAALKRSGWQLKDTLEDHLVLQPWPAAILPKHVLARIASLAERQTLNTLEALAEMACYHRRGLVSDEQLRAGFSGLLDADQAESLLGDSDKLRRRVLRTWLPAEEPVGGSHVSLVRRVR
jgi:hypothetical protein